MIAEASRSWAAGERIAKWQTQANRLQDLAGVPTRFHHRIRRERLWTIGSGFGL